MWIREKRPVCLNGEPIQWDGKSYAYAEYFKQNRIDPTIDPRYSKYYVNQRHTIAGSYVWAANKLTDLADELKNPVHSDKYIWIDVLINRQFDVDASKVVGVTGDIYCGCDVLILLSDSVFQRGWCLFEAANYTTKGCTVFVAGQCSFLQGEDHFAAMKFTELSDERLIKDEIAKMFGADCEAKFNRAIDDAMVQLYGESLLNNGRFQEAVPVFEKELEVKRRRGDGDGSVASTYNQLGRISESLGNYAEALRYYEETQQCYVRFYGDSHVAVASTYLNMANVKQQLGNFKESIELNEKALKIYIQSVGPAHVDVASTYCNMGFVYMQHGKLEKALEMFEKDLEITRKALGESHKRVADTYCNMGVVYRKLGNFEKALEMNEKDLEITIQNLGPCHVSLVDTLTTMSMIYDNLGDEAKALELTRRAHSICLVALGPDHPRTKNCARYI